MRLFIASCRLYVNEKRENPAFLAVMIDGFSSLYELSCFFCSKSDRGVYIYIYIVIPSSHRGQILAWWGWESFDTPPPLRAKNSRRYSFHYYKEKYRVVAHEKNTQMIII